MHFWYFWYLVRKTRIGDKLLDVRYIKRSLKLAEWRRLIEERDVSGKTIRVWCDENGVSKRIYYYWQRKIREAAINNVVLNNTEATPPTVSEESMPLVSADAPEFARIELRGSSATTAMSIRIGMTACEIYNGADIDVVERALLTLAKI